MKSMVVILEPADLQATETFSTHLTAYMRNYGYAIEIVPRPDAPSEEADSEIGEFLSHVARGITCMERVDVELQTYVSISTVGHECLPETCGVLFVAAREMKKRTAYSKFFITDEVSDAFRDGLVKRARETFRKHAGLRVRDGKNVRESDENRGILSLIDILVAGVIEANNCAIKPPPERQKAN